MKQLLAIMLCALMLCALCACGGGSDKSTETPDVPIATLIDGTAATDPKCYLPEDVFDDTDVPADPQNDPTEKEDPDPKKDTEAKPADPTDPVHDPKVTEKAPAETEAWPIYSGDEIILPPDEFDP